MFLNTCYTPHLDLPSFPTRRSSDLADAAVAGRHEAVVHVAGGAVDVPAEQVRVELPQLLSVRAHHLEPDHRDRKSTRLNSSHPSISYAVFCLKKKIFEAVI